MVIKESGQDRIFNIINNFILTIGFILVIYPLIFVLSASISDSNMVNAGKMLLLPKGITFEGYQEILKYKPLWVGYRNTIFYATFGTIINLILTLTCSYALSRKELKGRKMIMLMIVFTIYFRGGIIPDYLVVKSLELRNTVFAMLLPLAAHAYFIVITTTFFKSSIPHELYESADIDGCSDAGMFVHVVLPISTAIIAVMTLFHAVLHWNQFFQALLYLDNEELFPLQLVLRNILMQQEAISSGSIDDPEAAAKIALMAEMMKYGMIVVSIVPIVIAYPFVQRFFIKGIMVGAIKG